MDMIILPVTSSPLNVNTDETNKISRGQQDLKSRYCRTLHRLLTIARSLRNKIFVLNLLINANNYDIISVTESWTNFTKTLQSVNLQWDSNPQNTSNKTLIPDYQKENLNKMRVEADKINWLSTFNSNLNDLTTVQTCFNDR